MNIHYSKTSDQSSSTESPLEPSTKTIEMILNYSKSVISLKLLDQQTLILLN